MLQTKPLAQIKSFAITHHENHLAQVTIDAYLHEESADVKVGYVRLKAIADALANVDPSLSAWYSLPETKNGKAIALSSREEFIADYNRKTKIRQTMTPVFLLYNNS
ncbi:hypothetical protein FDU21_13335 [Xanthomonas oryzae pv. oryzae]|nr:hypothetical protein FDU21_13335 [Xanthomonas oryzae pv. oryzae]